MEYIPSPFERLQEQAPEAEIWWDAPPQTFSAFARSIVTAEQNVKNRHSLQRQLNRFFDPSSPHVCLVRGITTNPSIIAKWIQDDPEFWRNVIAQKQAEQINPCVETTFQLVYLEAIRLVSQAMMPLWKSSNGKYGWISGQTDPRLMFDETAMRAQAYRIAELGPNVMLKVPGTEQGYRVIRDLTAKGISTNSTLSFTVPQFVACIQAVEEGLAQAHLDGVNTSRWRSVITHMIGRFGKMNDLNSEANARDLTLDESDIRYAEIAILKKAYEIIQTGKHPCKMLLSSLLCDETSDCHSLSMHLEHTAGADIAYTCKPGFVRECFERQSELALLSRHSIDRPVPDKVMAKLMQLPTFRNAIDPKGIQPQNFASTGAFLGTFKEVNDNILRLINFVERQMEINSAISKSTTDLMPPPIPERAPFEWAAQ